jgi:class 3 adenylate cyclase/predicted ATPase/Tfp pilus assembly protein PilF
MHFARTRYGPTAMHPTDPTDSRLPTGSVTFLFTDIEGSTTLWEQRPDAMRVALARHDALLRQAIASSCGWIVKTTGDGVVAVFATAADALAACLAVQRALQAPQTADSKPEPAPSDTRGPLTLKVRMGLHTGEAELRDGDYFGGSLSRAARIMSAAHGGQVLVSAATAQLVRGQLPQGVSLREMGEHRLKGLLNPERLLQVVASDLRADFPPLASLTGHSLPAERDVFVGRREPLAELARRLEAGARLISVLGFGGTGKTRLVTRFGWTSLGEFPGGVWFCDLSEARSLEGILYAVAQGLDVPLGTEDPVIQLGRAIAGRGKCLVILDNFEQVARYAEETLGRWLNRASAARFVVTTREVLGLPGEEIVALAPLAPSEAAELFVLRAEAAKPGLLSSPEDEAAIAPLVKLLEGLPLAIELAAARVRVMPPRTLLLRMNERFKLLSSAGGRRDRQATLRAVFDWSWDLLSTPEKAALAQLSVFEGGFTLESVEAVLDLSAYDTAPWPIDTLQSLVQKSLVRQSTDDRFDLLVSVQEYAAEHLRTPGRYAGSGPAALVAAQVRHGAYFAGLDESADVADGCAELDNLVAACRRAAARGDVETAVRALEGAWMGLSLRGPFKVGVELASAVGDIAGLGAAAAARTKYVAGSALRAFGKSAEAYAQFEASVAGAHEVGDRHCEGNALIKLGVMDYNDARYGSARAHLEAALAIACELNDRRMQSDAHKALGSVDWYMERVSMAQGHYELALTLAREAGDRNRESGLLGNLAALALQEEGNIDEARSLFEAALAAAREVGNQQLECETLYNLGVLHRTQRDFDAALVQLEAALLLVRDLGYAMLECAVVGSLGMVCADQGRLDEASHYLDAALAMARELGERRREGIFQSDLGIVRARQAQFDAARSWLAASEVLFNAISDRWDLGLVQCRRAETEHLAGVPEAARAALGEAAVIAAEVGAGPHSELGLAIARVRDLLAFN